MGKNNNSLQNRPKWCGILQTRPLKYLGVDPDFRPGPNLIAQATAFCSGGFFSGDLKPLVIGKGLKSN
jgi:hypothetical protein